MDLEILKEKPVSKARPTPLLFVHGMWHGAWCWAEHFLPYFAQNGYLSCALSLRGHGNSQGQKRLRWTTMADYAFDVAQVADQMETRPVVVGHSMGGMVIQKYLESHAAPAAVLLASAPPKGVIPATLRVFRRHPLAFIKANLTMSMWPIVNTPTLAQEAFFSTDMPKEQVKRYFSQLQDDSYRVYLDMLGLNLPKPKRVKTSILVLGAANDTIFLSQDVKATAQAYATQAEFFSNMAHDMMLETNWQAVADRILAWLDKQNL